ncbi:MAG: hypothetical protein AB8B99_03165 [Phormidesmis sp.]
MNQNFNQLQVRFPGLGCWLFILGTAWLLGAIGLSGIIKSIAVLVLFVMLVPVLAFFGLRFWLKRNVINGSCPVCEQTLAGLKNTNMACPNCTTELVATVDGFERVAADGVIDIQAVDIQTSATTVDASSDESPVIDVEVQRLPEAD